MGFMATAAFAVAARPLLLTQALSGIFGSISLTAWICLLVWSQPWFFFLVVAELTSCAAPTAVRQLQSSKRRWTQHGFPHRLAPRRRDQFDRFVLPFPPLKIFNPNHLSTSILVPSSIVRNFFPRRNSIYMEIFNFGGLSRHESQSLLTQHRRFVHQSCSNCHRIGWIFLYRRLRPDQPMHLLQCAQCPPSSEARSCRHRSIGAVSAIDPTTK